ncbi:unnamed protein product [Amoebophrya sp. A120]|nr:unnamed protein product [Amoebophrya sp. A120]|eukprot:GSA120T00024147001.1
MPISREHIEKMLAAKKKKQEEKAAKKAANLARLAAGREKARQNREAARLAAQEGS